MDLGDPARRRRKGRGAIRRLDGSRRTVGVHRGRRCRHRRREAPVRRARPPADQPVGPQPGDRAVRRRNRPPRARGGARRSEPRRGARRRAGLFHRRGGRAELGATHAEPVRPDPHHRPPVDRAVLAPGPRRERDQHRTGSGDGFRHRLASDHAAVPGVAVRRRHAGLQRARLRLRLGHPRHRRGQARRR